MPDGINELISIKDPTIQLLHTNTFILLYQTFLKHREFFESFTDFLNDVDEKTATYAERFIKPTMENHNEE